MKVEPQALDQLLHPIFDPKAQEGCRRSPPRVCPPRRARRPGAIVFTADDAVAWAQKGKRVLLVRMETVPDDIHGMSVAQGVLTATGGMTSHAAVVGRQMGKPSVVGCGALDINAKATDAEGRRQDAQGRRPGLDRRLDRRGACWWRCRRAPPR